MDAGAGEGPHFGLISAMEIQSLNIDRQQNFVYCNDSVREVGSSKCGLLIMGMRGNDYTHNPVLAKRTKHFCASASCSREESQGWLLTVSVTLVMDSSDGPDLKIRNGGLHSWAGGKQLLWYEVHDVRLPIAFIFVFAQYDLFYMGRNSCTSTLRELLWQAIVLDLNNNDNADDGVLQPNVHAKEIEGLRPYSRFTPRSAGRLKCSCPKLAAEPSTLMMQNSSKRLTRRGERRFKN